MLRVAGADSTGRVINTTRISWTTNNIIPDSIITNMIWRSLEPPVFELNEPNVLSAEAALTSKNTFMILYTIKPVTKAFTTMDATNAVRATGVPQSAKTNWPSSNVVAASDPNQVARGKKNKFKSAYQMKID